MITDESKAANGTPYIVRAGNTGHTILDQKGAPQALVPFNLHEDGRPVVSSFKRSHEKAQQLAMNPKLESALVNLTKALDNLAHHRGRPSKLNEEAVLRAKEDADAVLAELRAPRRLRGQKEGQGAQ